MVCDVNKERVRLIDQASCWGWCPRKGGWYFRSSIKFVEPLEKTDWFVRSISSSPAVDVFCQ